MIKPGLAVVMLSALLLNAIPGRAQGIPEPASTAQGIATEGIAPSRWQPALPHGGQKARLLKWWAQWNDPVLLSLIESSQRTQVDLPRSVKAIEQVHDILPPVRLSQRANSASWETSLAQAAHGGTMPSPGSARADKDWHPARVALAAEIAEHYVGWIYCRQSAGDCAAHLRALAILSGLPLGEVSELMRARGLELPSVPVLREPRVSARLLEQRPDVAAAMLELEQTRIEIGRAEAQRHPRLQLRGELRPGRQGSPGHGADLEAQAVSGPSSSVESGPSSSVDGDTPDELVGPALTLPPFDASRLALVVEARQADYLAAASALRSRAQEAAREVRDALNQVAAAQQRRLDAPPRSERTAAVKSDEWLERAMAWIHLYRVASGSWGQDTRP